MAGDTHPAPSRRRRGATSSGNGRWAVAHLNLGSRVHRARCAGSHLALWNVRVCFSQEVSPRNALPRPCTQSRRSAQDSTCPHSLLARQPSPRASSCRGRALENLHRPAADPPLSLQKGFHLLTGTHYFKPLQWVLHVSLAFFERSEKM